MHVIHRCRCYALDRSTVLRRGLYTRKEKLEAWEGYVAFEEQQRGEDGRSGALNLALTVAHLAEADLVGGGLGTEEPSDDHEMNVSRPNRDPKPELVPEPNPDAS